MMVILNDHMFWFIIGFVFIVLEILDGSFSIFSPTGVGAIATSFSIYFGVTVHPLIVFSISVVLAYLMFRKINKMNSKDEDVNKY